MQNNKLVVILVLWSLFTLVVAENDTSAEADPENEQEEEADPGTEHTEHNESVSAQAQPTVPSSVVANFRKNELNPNNLKGARWELEITKPTDVYFAIEIRDISQISVTNSDFRLDLHVKQKWNEGSLSVPPGLFLDTDLNDTFITTDGEVLNDVWTPDVFIPNARTALVQSINYPQKSVRIYKNQTIIYSSNMFAILGCPMEFKWYPLGESAYFLHALFCSTSYLLQSALDSQHCRLILESFTYTGDKVLFHWDDFNPVGLPKNFRLRQYLLQTPLAIGTELHDRFGRNDTYSRLIVNFTLQRELGHHLIQVFIPTFLIVALSWFSFWLGLDAIPGRVSLLVTCMLTLVTMYTGLKQDLPPVSYIKMLDIWMAVCLGFIFAAMFEFIIARYIWYTQKKLSESKDKDNHNNYHNKNGEPKREEQNDLWTSRYINSPYDEFYRNPKHHRNGRRILHNAWEVPSDIENISFERKQARKPQGWDEAPPYHPYLPYPEEYRRYPYVHPHVHFKRNKNDAEFNHRKPKDKTKKLKDWEVLDKISRVTFPMLFAFFLATYWPILFFASGSRNQ